MLPYWHHGEAWEEEEAVESATHLLLHEMAVDAEGGVVVAVRHHEAKAGLLVRADLSLCLKK
jgi:hypothetical protein